MEIAIEILFVCLNSLIGRWMSVPESPESPIFTIVKMRAAGSLHLLFRDKIIKTGTVQW